ncbi:MAG: DUF721 domain-containing protein [Elusimicrobia bacterium]|nr:DUF721 domain-containing protein [Elusimicrobiota bacterium]
MSVQRKRPCWSTGGDLVRSFQWRAGMTGDRMVILGAVWQKELGHLCGHWELVGFKHGTVYVKPKSAAAAQELQLRAAGVVRSLNKYFDRAWIKSIKVAAR